MAEYINPQWRLPNEKTGNNQGYSMKSFSTSKRVSIPGLANNLNLTNKVSLSIWFKTTLSQNNYYILGLRGPLTANGFDLGMHGSSVGSYAALATSGSGGLLVNFAYDDGNWHHYVLTYDGTIRKFYIDGILKAELAASGNMVLDSSGDYFILATNDSFNRSGQGEVVDNCVFNYALSDGGVSVGSTATGQIADLYASTNPMALSSTPQAYYPLGNSAHTGANYLTPNGAIQDYVFKFNSNKIDLGLESSLGLGGASKYSTSLWFKKSSNSNTRCLWGYNYGDANGSGWYYWLSSGNLRIATGKNGIGSGFGFYEISANELPIDEWQHIVVVFNGTLSAGNDRIKVYHNGTNAVGTYSNSANFPATLPNGNSASNRNVYLGQLQLGGGSFSYNYDGELSNVQQWETDLSLANASTLYNYGSPIQTLASIPQNSNLKAWYKLDASEIYNSSITDWEVNQASSFWKNSVDFNLTDSSANKAYIQCANTTNLNLTGAMTISAWMKGDILSSGSYNGLGNMGNSGSRGYGLLKAPGTAAFIIAHSATSGQLVQSPANTWRENEWNHVVGVFDPNSRCELYLNGVFSATGTAYAQQTSTNPFQIGNRGDGQHYYNWLGQLSNVSIWNTALSNGSVSVGSVAGGEIATLYNGGEPLQDLLTGPQNSNLLSWWKLDNITTGIRDSKGTNNGTIVTLGDGSVSKFDQSVSALNGLSSGMTQANLVQSGLLTTTSYSPYALQFDGLSDKIDCGVSPFDETTGDITISAWVKRTAATATYAPIVSATQGVGGANTQFSFQFYGNSLSLFWKGLGGPELENVPTSAFTVANDVWYLVNFVRTGTTGRFYVNGNFIHLSTKTYADFISTGIPNLSIGAWWFSSNASVAGSISNVALWNTSLSTVELREVYNEGRPSNLNNFSGTAPIHWWQLGSNSSFTSPDWTCLDEIGSSNGISSNMIENRIVNGVGSSSNGVSTNMNLANNISGSSPNGEANGLSVNMTLANITGGVN